jgi:tRNA dimethylallyltransferase
MRKIIIIAGPTASGKTSLAVEMAKKIDGEIINADSLQVYKENPIISAQPTREEQQGVPHHLFGYVEGSEEYTVVRWVKDVISKISNIEKTPIIVGGSGFYLKHLIFGLSAIPDVNIEIRQNLRQLHCEIGNEALYNLLKEVDAEVANKLNINDYKRVLRSYEVFKSTGKSISYWQKKNISYFPLTLFSMLVIQPDRELLYNNCNQRFLIMLEQGVLKEVEHLMNKGYNPDQGIMKSHGVPELISYLKGEYSMDEAIVKSQQVVRNYAKRQTTWFKHQFKDSNLDIKFIDSSNVSHIANYSV